MLLELECRLKKHSKMNKYKANAHSPHSFIKHVCLKFQISQYEIAKYQKKGLINIIALKGGEKK